MFVVVVVGERDRGDGSGRVRCMVGARGVMEKYMIDAQSMLRRAHLRDYVELTCYISYHAEGEDLGSDAGVKTDLS